MILLFWIGSIYYIILTRTVDVNWLLWDIIIIILYFYGYANYCWLGSTPYYDSSFGKGKQNILFGTFGCSGQETSLIECDRIDHSLRNCSEAVAGVHCEGILQFWFPVLLLLYLMSV